MNLPDNNLTRPHTPIFPSWRYLLDIGPCYVVKCGFQVQVNDPKYLAKASSVIYIPHNSAGIVNQGDVLCFAGCGFGREKRNERPNKSNYLSGNFIAQADISAGSGWIAGGGDVGLRFG